MRNLFRKIGDWLLLLGLLLALSVTCHPDPACEDADGNGQVPRHCVDN